MKPRGEQHTNNNQYSRFRTVKGNLFYHKMLKDFRLPTPNPSRQIQILAALASYFMLLNGILNIANMAKAIIMDIGHTHNGLI